MTTIYTVLTHVEYEGSAIELVTDNKVQADLLAAKLNVYFSNNACYSDHTAVVVSNSNGTCTGHYAKDIDNLLAQSTEDTEDVDDFDGITLGQALADAFNR